MSYPNRIWYHKRGNNSYNMFQRVSWPELVSYKKYRVREKRCEYSRLWLKEDRVFNGFVTIDQNQRERYKHFRFKQFVTGYHHATLYGLSCHVPNSTHTVKRGASIYEVKLPYLNEIRGVLTLSQMCWKVIEENEVDTTSIKDLNITNPLK